ncbi:MAG: hypothetical protein ACK4GP_10885 [Deinococcus sp.]
MFNALHTDALTARSDAAPFSGRLNECREAARAARLSRLSYLLRGCWTLPRWHVTVTVRRPA